MLDLRPFARRPAPTTREIIECCQANADPRLPSPGATLSRNLLRVFHVKHPFLFAPRTFPRITPPDGLAAPPALARQGPCAARHGHSRDAQPQPTPPPRIIRSARHRPRTSRAPPGVAPATCAPRLTPPRVSHAPPDAASALHARRSASPSSCRTSPHPTSPPRLVGPGRRRLQRAAPRPTSPAARRPLSGTTHPARCPTSSHAFVPPYYLFSF